jgi:hypothetical protein
MSLLTKARTVAALGLRNVARVASYRLRLRAGIHAVQRLRVAPPARGTFFRAPVEVRHDPALARHLGTGSYFGWHAAESDAPPDWHRNALSGVQARACDADWWTLPDFDADLGDIKTVWEASRFDWALGFAQRAALGDDAQLRRLNAWLDDWSENNPPYRGHNWKCAQEASIRVMHLAVTALLLDQVDAPEPALVAFLQAHLRRIAPTVAYAMAQDNNHGTSEAAALFVGGSWLERQGVSEAAAWRRTGEHLLAERVARLVEPDGSFSQYSVTYHRLMLDTLSLVEVWRRKLGIPPLAEIVYRGADAATRWLRDMTDAVTGDAPNIGANDGANLLPLTGADYRDFRPSVMLASALFLGEDPFAESGPWRHQLDWLHLEAPVAEMPEQRSRLLDDGGYALLRRGRGLAVLRYPRFHFRPGHADALHLDLWHDGENLLRDGGTFSYNATGDVQAYFTGARGHNGIQFDDREQMPRLGRFLWGDWVKTERIEAPQERDGVVTSSAAYRDGAGATHERRVSLSDDSLHVDDTVGGFTSRAVLRWRLRPGAWRLVGTGCSDGHHDLRIAASVPIVRCELASGWESRYYMRREPVPVLEVELSTAGSVASTYRWTI